MLWHGLRPSLVQVTSVLLPAGQTAGMTSAKVLAYSLFLRKQDTSTQFPGHTTGSFDTFPYVLLTIRFTMPSQLTVLHAQ